MASRPELRPALARGQEPPEGDVAPNRLDRTRDELAAFKLEVARTYVPLSLIRDVDRRLSEQLLRIENKIENVRRDQENDK